MTMKKYTVCQSKFFGLITVNLSPKVFNFLTQENQGAHTVEPPLAATSLQRPISSESVLKVAEVQLYLKGGAICWAEFQMK